MTTDKRKLVEVRDLKMHFPIFGGFMRRQVGAVKAVDGVSFDIFEGETLGVVGESGCGKSTVGRAVLRLYEVTDGSVVIDGEDIATLSPEVLRRKRPTMQMVFQDPQASLNSRMTVAGIGSSTLVTLNRGGKVSEAEVAMVAAPDDPPAEETTLDDNTAIPGLTVARANPAVIARFGLPLVTKGVLVTDPGQIGARAGFQPGDTLVAINGQEMQTSGDVVEALTRPGRRLVVDLMRGGKRLTMQFRL